MNIFLHQPSLLLLTGTNINDNIQTISGYIRHEWLVNEIDKDKDKYGRIKMPMKRNVLFSDWKDLLKSFCKLFYSFSFTCLVVELFHFVYDVHANYVTNPRIMSSR